MKKKILFYTMAMIKGGTERNIANLANYFISDYDITIVTNINSSIEYKLNKKIKVIQIDNTDKRKEKLLLKIITKISNKRTKVLKQILEKENPNLIITFLPEPTLRALSLKTNIPIIVSIRNHPTSEYKGPLKIFRNHYFKKAKKIIVQDNNFKKYYPINIQKKIITIPNYISDEFLEKQKNIKKQKTIITASRLEKQKNIKLLIKSFKKINKKYSDYKIIIYGKGSQKKKLEKLIKRKNLINKIIIKDSTNNIKEELDKTSLFILSSNYEGMPNVLLEAMSRGLPVITTNSSEAISSIIKNKKNGIVIKKNNKKQLINSIEYLLNNQKEYQKISKESKKIINVFNKEKILSKWEQLITKYIK